MKRFTREIGLAIKQVAQERARRDYERYRAQLEASILKMKQSGKTSEEISAELSRARVEAWRGG